MLEPATNAGKRPSDRSLRAYHLARQHGRNSTLTVEEITAIIVSEGIDEPTAKEAVDSVLQDRRERWNQFLKQLGFSICVSIAAVVITCVSSNPKILGIIPLAALLLLAFYPWGWRPMKDQV